VGSGGLWLGSHMEGNLGRKDWLLYDSRNPPRYRNESSLYTRAGFDRYAELELVLKDQSVGDILRRHSLWYKCESLEI